MKRVILTGALGGIGTAATAELERRGATVVGLDVRPDESRGVLECDVRSQESVDGAIAAAIEQLGGGVDVLINNAGVGTPQSAGDKPDEKALAVVDINLLGPWRCTGAALPALRAARGRVVNVASGLAHLTVPFATAYTMSKRGLVGYSDALRLEHGDAITVTTVYPGYIRTAIHEESTDAGVALEGLVPAEPLEEAAKAMARAALGDPIRDLATTPRGTASYALLRHTPRRVLDAVTRAQLKRTARKGGFSDTGIAGEFARRMRG